MKGDFTKIIKEIVEKAPGKIEIVKLKEELRQRFSKLMRDELSSLDFQNYLQETIDD